MPQILASAYLMGSDEEHLESIYEEESKSLEKWKDSPGEVSEHDWRDYLGDRRSVIVPDYPGRRDARS